MWHECVKTVADQFNVPWFWMEPDAVPLTPDWLDKIEDEYLAAKKPFMLDKVITPTRSHNSGVGVYPGRVRDYTQRLWELSGGSPWDVFLAEEFTPFTHHTGLIHDKFYRVWEDPKSGPPVFPDAESLSIIEPGAVLFHRNKDGSLIERLRESRGSVSVTHPVLIGGEIVGATPAPATTGVDAMLRKIAELEERLKAQTVTTPVTDGKKQRTPAQIQAAKDRMAKARAGKKP